MVQNGVWNLSVDPSRNRLQGLIYRRREQTARVATTKYSRSLASLVVVALRHKGLYKQAVTFLGKLPAGELPGMPAQDRQSTVDTTARQRCARHLDEIAFG